MAKIAELRDRVEEFIASEVLPLDDEHDGDVEAAGGDALRRRLQAMALIVGEPSSWTSDRLPTVEGLAEENVAAGGAPLVEWEVHLALAYFKVGVIAAGIDHRFRAGAASGVGFATAADAVAPFFASARAVPGAAP